MVPANPRTNPAAAILGSAGANAENLPVTSIAGIFAAADVRSSLTKRWGTAVGEGRWPCNFVHAHLAAHDAVPAQK
jgi:thioredoxin reductase